MKYASYDANKGRRQTHTEVVSSYIDMMKRKYPMLSDDIDRNGKYLYENKVFPSMRGLQFSGLPIEINPIKIYNCSYIAIDSYKSFNEIMFLLLCGVGVGYSVQSYHVNQLPIIKQPDSSIRYLVQDSIEGWSDGLKYLIKSYMFGNSYPIFDYSDIRAKGSPITKSGGISPGYEPLEKTLTHVDGVLRNAVGRKLTTLEVHDICCFIAECIYSGGVREAAMISLFDRDDINMVKSKYMLDVKSIEICGKLSDGLFSCRLIMSDNHHSRPYSDCLTLNITKESFDQIKKTKKIHWYLVHPQRSRSNNSGVFIRGEVTKNEFDNYFDMMKDSGYGEPGIFWTNDISIGTNPCGEISLTSNNGGQFCNLTTINVGDNLTQKELNDRAKVASFFGTLQAGFTSFHYIRKNWKNITESEYLIGVSMTGICNGNVMSLNVGDAARVVNEENDRISDILGINRASRTTCIKPEGTTTLMAGLTGSGIHEPYSKYIKRAIRIKKHLPIYDVLLNSMPDLIEDCMINPSATAIFYYPMVSPNTIDGISHESPLDTLNRIKFFYSEWVCAGHRSGKNTNNVSATVYVDSEWGSVKSWLWQNRDYYSGITILPLNREPYNQAPLAKIDKTEYDRLKSMLVDIDFSLIKEYGDNTELINELACVGGYCDII